MASNAREPTGHQSPTIITVNGIYGNQSQWRAIKIIFISALMKRCHVEEIHKTGTEQTSWARPAGVHQ